MKKTILMFILLCLSTIKIINAQQWTAFNTINSDIPSNDIRTITIDKAGNIWIGGNGGIAKFSDAIWTVYSSYSNYYFNNGIAIDTSNKLWLTPNNGNTTLCLLNDSCYSYYDSTAYPSDTYWSYVLAIDANNNIWVAGGPDAHGKILKFDGNNWTAFNSLTSYTFSIKVDANQNIWLGNGSGIAKFDGVNWTRYLIPATGNNNIASIAIDTNDNKWLATNNGLTKFDGTITTYNTSNSGIPSNNVTSVAIDAFGNKWLGTDYGLAKFDGTNWTVYNKSNSGLPSNLIRSIAIGSEGKVWIGTQDEGLVVLDVTTSIKEESIVGSIKITVSPNPFSTSTTIKIENSPIENNNYEFKLYDIFGREVKHYKINNKELNIIREGLSNGLFFICLLQNNKIISTSKLVITD